VIDTTLDDTADATRDISDSARRMQSGNIRSYAGWVAVGAAAVIAYMIWTGTR
jgi:NADH-quinone oxidoreductase subunit L